MKFSIKGPFKENIYNLMRKAGYAFQRKDDIKSELVFIRPPSGYPRFHIYLKEENDSEENEELTFNLHLDQKKPIYKGATAHSGEYNSELVNQEAERIKGAIITGVAQPMNHYTLLAKSAVEKYIKNGEIISPPKDLPEEFFSRKTGIFVTIENQGELRACIGTYLPTRPNIAEEIINNAISAATQDYRFGKIKKEELLSLSYTVYMLNEPQEVKNLEELNPKKFGIIIKTAPFLYPNQKINFDENTKFKSGLLLPDLPGINTVEKQVSIACQKAGIDPDKEKIVIYKFTVKKYQ